MREDDNARRLPTLQLEQVDRDGGAENSRCRDVQHRRAVLPRWEKRDGDKTNTGGLNEALILTVRLLILGQPCMAFAAVFS